MQKEQYSRYETLHRDSNEPSIIETYERSGATVWRLASLNRGGLPDLWVNPPNGPGFFVEVKTATGTLSESQLVFKAHTPVHVVRTPKEARSTLGKTDIVLSKPFRRRSSLKTRIRKSRRRNRLFGLAIWQWEQDGAEVWVLERLDNGLPHFWVKPRYGSGFFAHIGNFGNTRPQIRFADLNHVDEMNISRSRRRRSKRKRRTQSAGCIVVIMVGVSLLLSTLLQQYIW